MSSLAATQIPKPADEQAFERANVVLWRCLLNDPNVQRNGRRGQRQNGVDLFGIRDGKSTHHVGVQCKLKSHEQGLTEAEVRGEVKKALTFMPALREYFIVTTAPDDVALQELARTITLELDATCGTRVFIWGWNTLEERISEHAAVRKAFDPSFSPHSDEVLSVGRQLLAEQSGMSAEIAAGFARLESNFGQVFQNFGTTPSDATGSRPSLEAQLDAEIDGYRDILNQGRPKTALQLLNAVLDRVRNQASGRIIFRIKANIGACHLAVGDDATAADLISEAYRHAPTEPKAVANQALALLLKGQWQEALRFATEELDAAPNNDALAGYLIQAACFDPEIDHPLMLVPAALHEKPPVLIAVTHFLRQRNRSPDWYTSARRATQLYPEDKQLRVLAAEAALDEIASNEAHKLSGALTPEQRAQMQAAIDILAAEWKQAQLNEGGIWDLQAGTCSNLIVAYRAVGDFPKALETAREGRAAAPLNEDVARRAFVVAMESGDIETATAALSTLPAGPDTTVLSVGLHAHNGEWRQVANLCSEIQDDLPDHDRVTLATLGRVAAIKQAPAASRRNLLDSLVADTEEDLSASLIVIQAARSEKAQDLVDVVYDRIIQKVDASTHRAERYGIAHQAALRNDWSTAADLLDGYVVEDKDSDELQILTRAYVNERPMRERGIRFFERLPAELRGSPFYVEAFALFHFNRGDLPRAEAALRAAIHGSTTTQCHMALFSTLRRQGRANEIGALLEGLDVESLVGSPADRITIAAELRAQGRGLDAMRIAYNILRTAQNDPDAALRYVGLVMSDLDAQLIPMPDAVTEDCWVRLVGSGSAAQNFLITSGPDRPAEGLISMTHPMALKCLGLKVNDTFEVDIGMGQRVTWRVSQIKHKYLHALHEVMENFQTWFPNRPGLWKFSLKDDGDVTPFLDQIKAFGERDQKLADLYLENHLPLEMVAAKSGRESLGLAEYIGSLGRSITTCIGTGPERAAALGLIHQHRRSVLVMDTYTAWVVATADLLDLLAMMFAELSVPQSVIDQLVALRDEHTIGRGPSMKISWRGGQFVRQEFSKEDNARNQAFIGDQIDKLRDRCLVVPVTAPDAMSELAKVIVSSFGVHILDPVLLVNQRAGLLLSEDMHFRQIGSAAIPIKGVWLHAILMSARDEGLIDTARYHKALVHLAARRHLHLSVNSGDLLAVFEQDNSEQLCSFSSVSESFGVPGAEMQSHVRVAQEFFREIWRHDIWRTVNRTKRGKATGILLERLVRNRSVDWEIVLVYFYRTGNAELRKYVEEWMIGHMYSLKSFKAVLEKFSQ